MTGSAAKLRIASVSFLNARPLIEGLDENPSVDLTLDVPSKLMDGLLDARYDVALLPVIDYQRLENLVLIPAGGIGSDGETLTVRVFSRVPIQEIRTLACDPDSHTSVALARIILAQRYGQRPEFIDLRNSTGNEHEARLLIGDKVIIDAPRDMAHQLDLGAEWKALTGLPFVFAAWMARNDVDVDRAFPILEHAKMAGLASIDAIVRRHGVPLGWPRDLAHQYLTGHLRFHIGQCELEAMRLFYRFAADEGLINAVRELKVKAPCTSWPIPAPCELDTSAR